MSEAAGISLRARFERFPATVKGAFILRGEDRDPHQVVFRRARIVAIGGSGDRPIPVPESPLDVAPRRDLFVPFELGVSDLEPGWYGLVCDLEVDGTPGEFDGGRRFAVPWPRATVRRGHVKVGKKLALGARIAVVVDQIECVGDSIRVLVSVDPPTSLASAKLSADGQRLEVLDVEIDEHTGRGKVTAYPLLRAHHELRIELRGRERGAEASLDVGLP